jgi:hypothetical protein
VAQMGIGSVLVNEKSLNTSVLLVAHTNIVLYNAVIYKKYTNP